jgi:hypothetical protein
MLIALSLAKRGGSGLHSAAQRVFGIESATAHGDDQMPDLDRRGFLGAAAATTKWRAPSSIQMISGAI